MKGVFMNSEFKNIYPKQVWTKEEYCPFKQQPNPQNDERLGGFLLPFIAGAAVSAPFWLVDGNNKQQPVYYPYPPQYQYYPVYVNGYPNNPMNYK